MRHIDASRSATALFRAACACAAALICVGAPSGGATPASGPAPLSFSFDPQKQVLVLMYHQVTNDPDGTSAGAGHYGPAVSPKQFDADLTYLERAGFNAVDPLTALRYLDGKIPASALPDHPFAVTFDDGFVSAWTQATSILRRHRIRAMMFVEGIRVDRTPGRLTSGQIRAMAASGIWEIESHGYTGHWALQIGPRPSDLSPYWYANLQWLPATRRLETKDEYEARVSADLLRSRTMLGRLSHRPVSVFAYPSGEYGQNIALPAGASADVLSGNQGHSNADGLTSLLDEALQRAGFQDAFAVDLPGSEAAASSANGPYHYPRIAGTLSSLDPSVQAMSDGALALPEISPTFRWLDCLPVWADGTRLWVASSAQPYLYRLDAATGRVDEAIPVPAMQNGRPGEPVLATGLFARSDGSMIVYQQKGWWDGGSPKMLSLRIERGAATDVKTIPLPEEANWFVAVTRLNQGVIAMTETGQFYELASMTDGSISASELWALPDDVPDWKSDGVGRFAGLAYAHGLLYVADRKTGVLLGVDPASGSVRESAALPAGSDVRAIGGDDAFLWLVDYAQDRRRLIRMRSNPVNAL